MPIRLNPIATMTQLLNSGTALMLTLPP